MVQSGDRTSKFPNKGTIWIIVASALGIMTLIGTTIYVIQRSGIRTNSDETVVTTAPLRAVSALGRIEPEGQIIRVAAAPTLSGARVKSILVSEGDFVQEGELIAITTEFDTKQAELARAQEELNVALADLNIVRAGAKQGEINAQQATLERLRAELISQQEVDLARLSRLRALYETERKERQATVDRLQAQLANAESELVRYRELKREGVISESEFDTRKLNFDTAQKSLQESRAMYQKSVSTINAEIQEVEAVTRQNVNSLTKQVSQAQARLDEIKEIRDVDIAQAEAQVQRARAMIAQAQIELDLTQIKAPTNGKIIEIQAREGENIDNSQGVVEMANVDQMLVVAEVYESDIAKIELGQEAIIESENNTFPDAIRGSVVQIGGKIGKKDVLETDPAASVDARVVEVKIAVHPQDNSIVENLIYSQVLVQILL